MMTRRTLDGALKWALRDFLREEWRASERSVSLIGKRLEDFRRPTGIDLRHGGGDLLLSPAENEVLEF